MCSLFRTSMPADSDDVASRDNARAFGLNSQTLSAFDFHADRNAFEVQDDVRDIFTNTGNAGKFMQNVVDLHAVIAAPCKDDIRTRRKALPNVRPKPRSSGSAINVA